MDVVFKLLLLRNRDLLHDMIEAVVDLPAPIDSLEVLNPEIPEDAPGDKSVVLDIRVCLQDGRQIDLEMQSTVPPGTRVRFLYYWAKGFVSSIGRGDEYTLLRPCISILWFKKPPVAVVSIPLDLRRGGLGLEGGPVPRARNPVPRTPKVTLGVHRPAG